MVRLRKTWMPALLAAPLLQCGHGGSQDTVRLVGTSTDGSSGRLEVFHDGEWGTVCDDGFDKNPSAAVVCKQLGFMSGGEVIKGVVTPGTGKVWLDDVECTGVETRIQNCPHLGWGEGNCGHDEDVGVRCFGRNLNNLKVRLADTRNVYTGRLELEIRGEWGTVCDRTGRTFDNTDATVACNMLGYTTGEALPAEDVVDGSGKVWFEGVNCAGPEALLNYCTVSWDSVCPHSQDVGVACSGASLASPSLVFEKWLDASAGVMFYLAVVQVSPLLAPLTLCVSDFTDAVAAVICRQLGSSGGSVDRRFSVQMPGHLANIPCTGSEATLDECGPDWEGVAGAVTTCSADQVAAVRCTGSTAYTQQPHNPSGGLNLVDGSLRLVAGSSSSSGRLEVYHDNQWGTVCDDGPFDATNARVACMQIRNTQSRGSILAGTEYTRGSYSQPIWMDEVDCVGNEGKLKDCAFPGFGEQDCGHSEDVGITCTEMSGRTITGVRLANGATFREGRLEVCEANDDALCGTDIVDAWSTVCDFTFNPTNAEVVCRELGHAGGDVILGPELNDPTQNRTGPILPEDVSCAGGESSFFDCHHEPINQVCSHDQDVGVSCKVGSVAGAGNEAVQDEPAGVKAEDIVLGIFGWICVCCCCVCCCFICCKRSSSRSAVITPIAAPVSVSVDVSPSTPKKFVGKVEVVDEEKVPTNTVSRDNIPKYWTSNNDTATDAFDQMVYVNTDAFQAFNDLLAHSYRPIATQDRPCPKKVQCAKTPGGCACVKPGGDPGLPTGFVVRRVIRVEEADMWARYVKKKEAIKNKRNGDVGKLDPPIFTEADANRHGEVFLGLDASVNETYLWHGTHVRAALAIAQDDFNIDLAGTGAGTMYGRGAYMAESSTKADEYSKDEPDGYYDGVFAIVLCRVVLGKFFYTTDRDPSAQGKVTSGQFDSTCGDRVKSVNTYRELVVYNNDQIYPEFVVLYNRVYKKDNLGQMRQEVEKHLLHMQLPVYWNNCHLDPAKDAFRKHYRVKKQTINLIQKLVTGAASKNPPTVVRVRRVEDSEMWTNYVNFRAEVVARPGRPKPIHELDGDPHSGHVITQALLDSDELEEQAISIENLDARANELLLWHGTSQEAAEAIASEGFQIARGSATHGKRFGEGAYFAEDLTKSLSYTSGGGTLYVLLCRIVCGDMYYTEDGSDTIAHLHARNSHKDSVLANPRRNGPREFVVLRNEQVYPEFILELNP